MGNMSGAGDFAVATPNDIWAVVGDFNYDPRNNVQHTILAQEGVRLFAYAIRANPEMGWRTMYQRVDLATMDGHNYTRDICLDNMFVRWIAPAVRPPNARAARIIGVLGLPDGFTMWMEDSIDEILEMEDLNDAEKLELFREPQNYGSIGHGRQGVSDHMPIFMDI